MESYLMTSSIDLGCNCNCASKIDRKCAYNKECRKMCVVYKATSKICDKSYIGQPQPKTKGSSGPAP
jgi:hypothetical protein